MIKPCKRLGYALLLMSAPAWADPVAWRISAGAEMSDNMRQSMQNEKSDTRINTDVSLSQAAHQGKLNYAWTLSAGAEHYVNDSYADRLNAQGQLNSIWRPSVYWDASLSDVLTQERIDRTQADNPDNTTRKNVLSASVGRVLAPQSAWPVRLSITHVRTEYSEASETDSYRHRLGADATHALNPRTGLTMGLSAEHTEFDTDSDNDRYQALLGVTRKLSSGEARLSVGTVRLDTTDSMGRTTHYTGASYEAHLSGQRGAHQSWSLDVERTLDDTTSDRLALSPAGELLTLQASQAVRVTRVVLTGQQAWARSILTQLEMGYSHEDTLGQNDRSEQFFVRFHPSWALTRRVNIGADLGAQRESGTGLTSTLYDASLWYRRAITRSLSVSSRLTHRRRVHELASNEWDENRLMLSLEWQGGAYD